MNTPHHAIVVGGGPAGSSAAAHLARRGWRVTLCEAKQFPRIKVCGEFISPAAVEHLEALLPPRRLSELGARRVHELVIEVDDRSATWPMPGAERSHEPGVTSSPPGGAWVLSRATLDDALLKVVRETGADVRQPAIVRTVDYADNHITASLEDGTRLRADIVVHADGHGRLDSAAHHARTTPTRRGVLGHKCHLRMPAGMQVQGLRMRAAAGAYVGTVAVEANAATVALVARHELIATCRGDADVMLAQLWPGYDPAWRCSPWLSCGVAGSPYLPPAHPRSFRVGNAAAAVEPVGGEGIGLALWSGATLSRLLPAPDERLDQAALARTHQDMARLYRARLRTRRPACRAAAALLMRPALVRALWPALALPALRNLLVAPWYALTGKPV